MPIIPTDREQAIQFCEQHIQPWTTNAVALGITAANVAALNTAAQAARAKLNAAKVSRQVSRAATEDYYAHVAAMRTQAADLVATIKLRAETNDDPNIYTLAQIPPPAAPQPLPAPGTPQNVTFVLTSGGALAIRFTAQNAAASTGAMFNVSRRLGNDASMPFSPIGATPGTRGGRGAGAGARTIEFADTTLPLGTQQVSYIIQPQRAGRIGTPTDILSVQFGVGMGGGGASSGMTVTRSSSAGVRIAA